MQLLASYLDAALAHIEVRGDTDIFPLPFEFRAIRHSWSSVQQTFTNCQPMEWQPGIERHALIPKGEFGFRIATQLDPFDSIFLTALVLQVADQLESIRVSTSENVVFSHRYLPGPREQIFDPTMTFEAFRKRSVELAETGEFSHVVLTDIGDFYSRIYQHPLENVIAEATDDETAKVFAQFFSRLSSKKSHGIPIGPSVCRLLADVDINDVDFALRSHSYTYCRYSDDFRIFASSAKAAREALAYLATTLYQNHGLTLQASKTSILTTDEYLERYAESDDSRAGRRFEELLGTEMIFRSSPYEFLTWEDLSPEDQDELTRANLWSLLQEALEQEPIDQRVAIYALRWLRLAPEESHVDYVFSQLDKLYPAFRHVMEFFLRYSTSLPDKNAFAGRVLGMLNHSKIGVLEYQRQLILDPFASDPDWNHQDQLVSLYESNNDGATRRTVTLALGIQGQRNWFRNKKTEAVDMKEWEKRAFLFGARCMSTDEANNWYSSISPKLNELDRVVVKYAKHIR